MSHLGHVFIPSSGQPVGSFQFVLDADASEVEVGTLVAAETTEGRVVGAVTDMRAVGHASNPHEVYHTAMLETAQQRREVMVAEVQVYAAPLMRPTSFGSVTPASAADVHVASGVDRMKWPVPSGVIELLDGETAPVCLDGHSLLGPEAGHVMIGGLSGQAAKTSFASVLLKSALHASSGSERTAALLFNVKGSDLLFLDRPPQPGYELSDRDRELYAALGAPAEPFGDVTVFSPTLPHTGQTRSQRDDAVPVSWTLRDVWGYLRYLFPGIGRDEKLQSLLSDVGGLVMGGSQPLDSFTKLEAWFDGVLATVDDKGNPEQWPFAGHHRATLLRLRRMLIKLPGRFGGLLAPQGTRGRDVPVSFHAGEVRVVDIAGLDPLVQSLVVARVVERVLSAAEHSELGVDHLVVLVDELNTYAPSGPTEYGEVRSVLQRVSTQGRYAGVSLWGMAQKLSKIDELVRDNAATRVLGVTPEGELQSGVYGRLSNGLAQRLTMLEKGRMVVWHYSLRSPTLIAFPRPAWQMGRIDAGPRKTVMAAVADDARSVEMLTAGLHAEEVEAIVASASSKQDAEARLAAARRLDASHTRLRAPATSVDPDNPFNLDF